MVSESSVREHREVPTATEVLMSSIMALVNFDTDVFLLKSLVAVIFLSALWPLAFLGYLVTVYGDRILVW
jgi:hypothetical protein